MKKSNPWQSLINTFKDVKETPKRSRCRTKQTAINRSLSMKGKSAIQPLPLFININGKLSKTEKENAVNEMAKKTISPYKRRDVQSSVMSVNENSTPQHTYWADSDEDKTADAHKKNASCNNSLRKPLYCIRSNASTKNKNLDGSVYETSDDRNSKNSIKMSTTLHSAPRNGKGNVSTPILKSSLNSRTPARRSQWPRTNLSAEQEELENSIVWSDSDNEDHTVNVNAYNNKANSSKRRCVTQSDSPISLKSTQDDLFIDTQSSGLSIPLGTLQAEAGIQLGLSKRLKPKKGSMSERLQCSLNSIRSDLSFWINERQSNIIPPGEIVQVEAIEKTYGRILVYCNCSTGERRIICLSPCHPKLKSLRVGQTIEVEFQGHHPYRIEENLLAYTSVNKIMF